MTRPTTRRGEFEIIEEIFAPLAQGSAGAFGLVDDAAAVRVRPGHELIVTSDALVEGVHFLAGDHAALVARKLLRVNLSDLAAMGAAPVGYLVDTVLPRDIDEAWLWRFADGLREDQGIYGIALLGGDTTAVDGPLVLTLTALGEVPEGQALLRSGAEVGDHVYVSGTLGDGALGLRAAKGELDGLEESARGYLVARYTLPEPRLDLGERLRGLAHAVIDVSDGLVADLGHVCESSGCGAVVEAARLPLSAPARAALDDAPALMLQVLGGGDDYELLFTVAARHEAAVAALSAELGLALTRIGHVVPESGVRVLDSQGRAMEIAEGGYHHF